VLRSPRGFPVVRRAVFRSDDGPLRSLDCVSLSKDGCCRESGRDGQGNELEKGHLSELI
jgi:hypothetical protein